MAAQVLMSEAFVDTDVIIRYIIGDDTVKQRAAVELFCQVERGTQTLRAPDTVIADAVFVLSSPRLYALPRARIRTELATLLLYPQFKVHNRRLLLRAGCLCQYQPGLRRCYDRRDDGTTR